MRVPPSDEIIIAYVHSPGVADFAVDDDDLPVVAIIELGEQIHQRPVRLRELFHLDTRLLHLIVILRADGDIGDILVNEPDLDPLAGLLHQHFLDLLASLVLAEIEILHVDVVFRIPQILHQQLELPVSRCDDFHIIAVGHAGRAVGSQQPCQGLVVIPDKVILAMPEKQLPNPSVRPFPEDSDEPPVLYRKVPGLPDIDAHHKVEQESDNRQNRDDQYPGYLLGRVPVIEDDDDHRPEDNQDEEGVEYAGEPLHML